MQINQQRSSEKNQMRFHIMCTYNNHISSRLCQFSAQICDGHSHILLHNCKTIYTCGPCLITTCSETIQLCQSQYPHSHVTAICNLLCQLQWGSWQKIENGDHMTSNLMALWDLPNNSNGKCQNFHC